MITFTLSTEHHDVASQNFSDRLAAQTLVQNAQGLTKEVRANPAQLWAYASGALTWPQADLDMQLRSSEPMRNTFRNMIEKATPFHLPQARAASSDALPQRDGKNCRLSMGPSRAEPNQLYLIVELRNVRHDTPVQLTLCNHRQEFIRIDLPTPRNGIAQILLDRSSDVVQWLSDPRTEAFVR